MKIADSTTLPSDNLSNQANQIPIVELTQADKPYKVVEKIYPKSFTGRYRRLRQAIGGPLLLLFFATAWFDWNGHQAVLFDLQKQLFYVFGTTFWPQDFFLLTLLLIISAFALFVSTVIAGRVWCGFGCPQSVWTWMFMWIDKVVEGDRNQRIKLDKAPWTKEKLSKKLTKHSLWIALSLITGLTFVGYFVPIKSLVVDFFNGESGSWASFWVFLVASLTYLNAGWLREQVCLHICPYSRFQSVMFDRDTQVISYDQQRGEQRGARSKNTNHREQGLGDCVDCTLCVQVCPTGIDIRDGLQPQCIGCAACIDACDGVMNKLNYPTGLIRYASEQELDGQRPHLWRPRLVGYVGMLVVVLLVVPVYLSQRIPLEVTALRDRQSLYSISQQGQVENSYTIKVGNKDQQPHRYRLSITGIDAEILVGPREFSVAAGEMVKVPVTLQMDPEKALTSGNDISFHIQAVDNQNISQTSNSRFFSPASISF